MKRYKPKPVVISQKQKDQVEDLKNFTKAQLTKKIEQYEMEETSQKECKKREKYGMIEFLKKLENEWLTFEQGLLQIYYKGICWIFVLYIFIFEKYF